MVLTKRKAKKTTHSTSESDLYYYDHEAAERAVNFFPTYLTHIDGKLAKTPYHLQEWEKNEVIRPIFGWKRKADGFRRYRKVFLFVPRKNSKTTLATGIGLYMAFGFKTIGAQIFNAAATKDQAKISFDIARKMIEQNESLMNACELYHSSIMISKTFTRYKVLSSDGESQTGYNASCAIIDEVHAHKKRSLIDALTTSSGTQDEPLFLYTTTAGSSDILKEIYDLSKDVKNGITQVDTLLPIIYEAQEGDDPYDEAVWARCNPNYGVTIKPEFLRDEFNQAKKSPGYLNICKRFYLNVFTASESVYIAPEVWTLCNFNPVTLEDMKGRTCFVGLDISSFSDYLPMALFFPGVDDQPHQVLMYYWITQFKAEQDPINYAWRDEGYLTITPDNGHDYPDIIKKIIEITSEIDIKILGYNQYNSKDFAVNVASETGMEINPWPPNSISRWNAPTKKLIEMATTKTINHGGNPILARNVDDVVLKTEGEYIRPNKAASKGNITGVTALIIAIGEYMNYQEVPAADFGIYFMDKSGTIQKG